MLISYVAGERVELTVHKESVSYVHQLEKKLMKSNNKYLADQECKWEKFQLYCRGTEN